MHNISDQELDRLSKEAAENYEAAASPELWDKLQKRLDVEMPESKKDKRRFFWLFFFTGTALLISLAVGISVMKNKNETSYKINTSNQNSGILTGEENNSANNAGIDKKIIPIKPNQELRNTDPAIPSSNPSTNTTKSGPVLSEKNKNNNIQLKNISEKEITAEKRITSLSNNHQDQFKKNAEQKNNSLMHPSGQTSNIQVTENQKQKDADPLIDQGKNDKLSVTAATNTDNEQIKMVESPALPEKTTAIEKDKTLHKKSWEFAAVFGPDYSNVGFTAPDKTGMNLGILVSYRFTKRLSVQTGLLYSEKHYTTTGNDYTGYPGYNATNPNLKMQKVQANCFMWDMPLNLRYDWLLRKKARSFISTGLSSYFMNKEDLHYYYTYNNYDRYKAWVNEKNSSYWMAAVNISVGYEQLITPQFSVQVEPFFKIPVSQIGYGNIHLNTLGVFLSVKYSPQIKSFKNTKNR